MSNNLLTPPNSFKSEFGWTITLAGGWTRMPGSGRDMVPTTSFPIVFTGPEYAQGTLTWMIAGDPIDQVIADRFRTMTLGVGPLDLEISRSIATPIFPLLGSLLDAQVVRLPDDVTALELVERIGEDRKGGYQLIIPLQGTINQPITFQRLCYYAPEKAFDSALPIVREMARSFHYESPYLMQEHPRLSL